MLFYNFYYHYDCSTFYFSRYSKAKYSIFIISGFTSSRSHNIYIDRWIFLFTVIVFIWRTTAPPLPEITYGEFPFSLEYEIDEERILIEDTVIAEFIGSFRGNVTTQPRRSWSIKLLNNSGELKAFHYEFLIIESEDVTITLSSGSAGYFMNDGGSKPQLTVRDRIAGFMHFSHYDLEEARKILAEYGITLINWEYATPIRNFFNDYY